MNKMRYILYIWSAALVLTACGGSGRQPAGDESVAPADSMINDGATEEGVADTTATVADADERAGAPADTAAAAQDQDQHDHDHDHHHHHHHNLNLDQLSLGLTFDPFLGWYGIFISDAF